VFHRLFKSYFISCIRKICTKYTKNQQEINVPKEKKQIVSAKDKKNNQKYKDNIKFYRVGKKVFPWGNAVILNSINKKFYTKLKHVKNGIFPVLNSLS
jgi:hypothetical protein